MKPSSHEFHRRPATAHAVPEERVKPSPRIDVNDDAGMRVTGRSQIAESLFRNE
jgi:hypothetical protein